MTDPLFSIGRLKNVLPRALLQNLYKFRIPIAIKNKWKPLDHFRGRLPSRYTIYGKYYKCKNGHVHVRIGMR